MNQRLRYLGGLAVVLAAYGAATLPILKSFPPIWPDEVLYYSPTISLARGQGFGTSVLAGFLPGIGQYTYWHFPGYPIFLLPLMRIFSPSHHLDVMRISSWLLGVVVLLLGAFLLRQLGANSVPALLSLAVLGTQVGFMQDANIGRMEMLVLACTVAGLCVYLAWRKTHQRRLIALSGLFVGLALICHPAGILGGFVIVLHEAAAPSWRKLENGTAIPGVPPVPWQSRALVLLKDAAVFGASAALPFIPWVIYILQAPKLYAAQMAVQSTQKWSYLGGIIVAHGFRYWLMFPFWNSVCPVGARWLAVWPLPVGSAAWVPLLILVVGLGGLLVAGRNQRIEVSILGTWALAGYAFNLFMTEYWYTVYLLAPACLLLGWVVSASTRRWARAVALAVLLAAGAWNFAEAKMMWWYSRDGWQAYQLYCLSLAQMIPADSSILLAAIPDPYFGLVAQNKSYKFFEFVPVGVPVEQAAADQALDHVDYVVTSDCCRPRYLNTYLAAHGKVIAEMGQRDFVSPPLALWKLRGSPALPSARDSH